MLALGEAVPLPTRVQIYKPDPPPKSNDVDYYTHWKSKPMDLDVHTIVERWRTQDRSRS